MKLVLAEKPSVAQSIAKVLGATKREDGYLEGNGYVVSWCVGHLVELSQPEAYDEKYNKWAYADLPIFPDQWKYQVSASTKKQFGMQILWHPPTVCRKWQECLGYIVRPFTISLPMKILSLSRLADISELPKRALKNGIRIRPATS